MNAPPERNAADMLARYIYDRTSFRRIRKRNKIRKSLVLPQLHHRRRVAGSVWAVSVVKNEIDIIGQSVQHMLDQGVDHVLIADNGSTDGTLEVLRRMEQVAPVHVAVDQREGQFQAVRHNLLIRESRRAGADWIVPFDADEFYYAEGSTIASWLRACQAPVVGVELHNAFPKRTASAGDSCDVPYRICSAPGQMARVVHRAHRLAHVSAGSVTVSRSGKTTTGLYMVHLPWRSKEQLIAKVRGSARALDQARAPAAEGIHYRWLNALDDDALAEVWEKVLDWEKDERLFWYPDGRPCEADFLSWRKWDPDGLVAE